MPTSAGAHLPPAVRPRHNRVRDALADGRFFLTVEVASPTASQPFDDAVRPIVALARAAASDGRVAAIALTDRSRSDHDHDPVAIGAHLAAATGVVPLVHLAGKDRSPADLDAALRRAQAAGLDAFLLVTGDALRAPPRDRPVRYLDAVLALAQARQQAPGALLAAAVCPFKYREEELLGQYLKAGKKVRAGADVLITQIGWDMRKYHEARAVLAARGYDVPLVAGLLWLTPRGCRRLRQTPLPGVVVTDELARRLEEEACAPDGGQAAAFRRLALQIVGVRLLGYAGAQVSGLHTWPKVERLLEEVDAVATACPDLDAWQQAWGEMLTLPDGRQARVAPDDGYYLDGAFPVDGARPGRVEALRFRLLDAVDRAVFHDGSAGARVLGPLVRALEGRAGADALLAALEGAVKGPLVGCRRCGFCRLPATAYVCPETCPKGLANGPCGGSRDGRCEVAAHECIHHRIYRLAKAAGRLDDLEHLLIPAVPEAHRDRCSWLVHFQGGGPHPARLPTGGDGRRVSAPAR
ncbi:MAG: methylenetetrahydrofolate reductase C-terminal domain-containing protein [Armatimonadota bacterium]|nr:methylenetetrahydrofolate reductase C-terminal domain-containing protein [Armatimonadota bacterium]